MSLIFKITHVPTCTTRRVPLPSTSSWDSFAAALRLRFGLTNDDEESLALQWEDEDGDLLTISSQAEWTEWLQLVDQTKSIKMILQVPSPAAAACASLGSTATFVAPSERAASPFEQMKAAVEVNGEDHSSIVTLPEAAIAEPEQVIIIANSESTEPIEFWWEESSDSEDGEEVVDIAKSDMSTRVEVREDKGKGRAPRSEVGEGEFELGGAVDVVEDPREEGLPLAEAEDGFQPSTKVLEEGEDQTAAEDPAEPSLPPSEPTELPPFLRNLLSSPHHHQPLSTLLASLPRDLEALSTQFQLGLSEFLTRVREEAESVREGFERETERIKEEVEERRRRRDAAGGDDGKQEEGTTAAEEGGSRREPSVEIEVEGKKEEARRIARERRRIARQGGGGSTKTEPATLKVREVRRKSNEKMMSELMKDEFKRPIPHEATAARAAPSKPTSPLLTTAAAAASDLSSLPSDDMYHRRFPSTMPGAFGAFPSHPPLGTLPRAGSTIHIPPPRSSSAATTTIPGSFPSSSTTLHHTSQAIPSTSRLPSEAENEWGEITPAMLKRKLAELGFDLKDLGTRIAAERAWDANRGRSLEVMVEAAVLLLCK